MLFFSNLLRFCPILGERQRNLERGKKGGFLFLIVMEGTIAVIKNKVTLVESGILWIITGELLSI